MRVHLYWVKVPGRIMRACSSQTSLLPLLRWCFNKRAVEHSWCSSSPLACQISSIRKQDSGSIRHPSRTCTFVPQLLALSQVQSDSLYSSQKTKAVPTPTPPPSPQLWKKECVEVWVVMQIANCAGHRGKRERNGSVSARHAEGGEKRTGVSHPLYSSLPLLSLSLSTLNWQLAGKWMRCEVSPLKCRVLLFRQQRSSMRDICCSVIRIYSITCLPSLALSSFLFSTAALQHPFCQPKAGPFFHPTSLRRTSPLTTSSSIPFSFASLIPPSTWSFSCFYSNSLGLADNLGVLPIWS